MKTIALVGYPGCWATSIVMIKDFFRVVTLLEQYCEPSPAVQYEVSLISEQQQDIRCSNGINIAADAGLDERVYDLIIVAAMEGLHMAATLQHETAVLAWLSQQQQQRIPLIAITTGVALVAASGKAPLTLCCHAGFINYFKKTFPHLTFSGGNGHVHDGHVCSTGSPKAVLEVLLAMVNADKGAAFAAQCRHYLLLSEPTHIEPLLPQYRTHLDADILAVQDWLDGHHAEAITIDGLAQQFGYSSRTLKRRFALATGSSPNKYLQEIRIAKAKKLLSLSDLSSKEIAYAVGYDNHSHFSRLFKRHCGLTPMEWKHRHAPAHSGE